MVPVDHLISTRELKHVQWSLFSKLLNLSLFKSLVTNCLLSIVQLFILTVYTYRYMRIFGCVASALNISLGINNNQPPMKIGVCVSLVLCVNKVHGHVPHIIGFLKASDLISLFYSSSHHENVKRTRRKRKEPENWGGWAWTFLLHLIKLKGDVTKLQSTINIKKHNENEHLHVSSCMLMSLTFI